MIFTLAIFYWSTMDGHSKREVIEIFNMNKKNVIARFLTFQLCWEWVINPTPSKVMYCISNEKGPVPYKSWLHLNICKPRAIMGCNPIKKKLTWQLLVTQWQSNKNKNNVTLFKKAIDTPPLSTCSSGSRRMFNSSVLSLTSGQ